MSTETSWPDNPFWDFSLRLYARPGVAPACLDLQIRHNLDVNIVLYCVWLGAERGVRLDDRAAARIVGQVSGWHDAVVRALRAVRVNLKGDTHGGPPPLSDRLRTAVKRDELDAEHIEQEMLSALTWSDAPHATPSPTIARGNVDTYLRTLGIQPNSEDASAIGAIVAKIGK